MKRKKWPDVHKYLLALHQTITREDHFLSDTESPEDAQEVFTGMGKVWEKLFAQPTDKWTQRPEDADMWKAHLRCYNKKLQGYEALMGDDETGEFHIPVKHVTS